MHGVRIGLIGDYSPDVIAHDAIERTLTLARADAFPELTWSWLHTAELTGPGSHRLDAFDGLWCVPATPYADADAALAAIRFARERERPFLGTCGGFQHALIEYARSVLHLKAADHAETSPEGEELVITPLACALVEQSGTVILREGTHIRSICGVERLREGYHCSYGVNASYRAAFEGSGMRFGAEDEAGDVRALELPDHPFFLGTLFQPERAALEGAVHPICLALLSASAEHAQSRQDERVGGTRG